MFTCVKLQTWVGEKKARYWVVNATGQTRDVNFSSGSGSKEEEASAAIEAEVTQWEEETKQARLKISQSVSATEISPWLRMTDWPQVLAKSTHDLVTTYQFTATATATEPDLERV